MNYFSFGLCKGIFRLGAFFVLSFAFVCFAEDLSVSVYPLRSTYQPPRVWGLTALQKRKTTDVFQEADGSYQTERTIFRDPNFGGEVYRLTSHTAHEMHWYQDMSPWNANGSKIMFYSERLKDSSILMDADGAKVQFYKTKLPLDARRPAWSRVDPAIHYSLVKGVLYEHNIQTHESRELAKTGGESIYQDPSRDGRYILCFGGPSYLHDLKTGKTVEFDVLRNSPIPQLAGKPCKLDEAQLVLDPEYPVRYDEDYSKKGNATNSGWYCVAADGVKAVHAFWLRNEPDYRKFKDHPGHPSWNPDGTKMIFFDRVSNQGIFLISKDGSVEKRLINDAGNKHTTWLHDSPDFAFAEAGGNFLEGILVKIFTSEAQLGTVHRIVFHGSKDLPTKNKKDKKDYWSTPRLASSPDGTKVFWTSSAFDNRDVYFAVSKHPDPPTIRLEGNALRWNPPQWHKEIKGYLVYAAKQSGGPYDLLTPEPISSKEFAVPSGAGPCFVMSSLEYSGLESQVLSNEVCQQNVSKFRLYFQAEDQIPQAPIRLDSDALATGEVCVWFSPGANGSFEVPVNVPMDGEFLVWARTRGAAGDKLMVQNVGAGVADSPFWKWVPVGKIRGKKGQSKLVISSAKPGTARLDAICLTNDSAFLPVDRCNLDRIAPQKVQILKTQAQGSRVQLSWTPVTDPNFSHYNIHAGTDPSYLPGQGTLLFSPKANQFVDVGVPNGVYYYKIVAVDRCGNISQASDGQKVEVNGR
jgi:hypothetical protein